MISGFLVIDKPRGITSHDVVSRVRRILGTRRVGHTGTLDPFATGVLPVAVNDGTKVIPFLDEGVKQYDALLRLGVVTDTLDLTGSVLSRQDGSGVGRERLEALMARFTGVISQVPPMYSAIKKDGRPLYKLARQGIEVERQPRRVEVLSQELLLFDPPLVGIRVTCSRGTYIRSLVHDMGAELGCGAALQELRRIASGPFRLSAAVTIDRLEECRSQGMVESLCVTPFDILGHLPDVPLTEIGHGRVLHGRSPRWEDTTLSAPPLAAPPSRLVRLSRGGILVAVAELSLAAEGECRLILKRVFA